MITHLFKKTKDLRFERTYPASIDVVWRAWTDPDELRQWWGPEKTTIDECEVEPRVGGRIFVVTVAGEEMGKYAGTRWPMEGTVSLVDEPTRLGYDARSWTEGEKGSTIHHTNEIVLTEVDGVTTVAMHVAITQVGPKAKMAAFGMKWGYKQQLDQLTAHLVAPT